MDEIIYRWIADYSLGVIGREDFEQLKVWIETSPQNRIMFDVKLVFKVGWMRRVRGEVWKEN